MKDILSLAVFAATVSGLMVFVTVLTPGGSIRVLQTSTKLVNCRIERSGTGMRPEHPGSGLASQC